MHTDNTKFDATPRAKIESQLDTMRENLKPEPMCNTEFVPYQILQLGRKYLIELDGKLRIKLDSKRSMKPYEA